MTKRECAIVMAHTGVVTLCGKDIQYYYEYLEYLFGRPVYMHEVPALEIEIKKRSRDDFVRMCETAEDYYAESVTES